MISRYVYHHKIQFARYAFGGKLQSFLLEQFIFFGLEKRVHIFGEIAVSVRESVRAVGSDFSAVFEFYLQPESAAVKNVTVEFIEPVPPYDPVLFADITYSFYEVWADFCGFKKELIPVKDDMSIDINDYRKENGGIVIANPNAPTGELLPLEKIEEVLQFNRDSIVIVDEAYIDFGGESAVKLIDKYDNLIVTQTYSKSRNLAGLRIGMAFANPELIAKIKAVKFSINSYTLNEPSLRVASAILKDDAYFKECCEKVIKTREWSEEEFKKLGFVFPESKANFVFVTHPKINANDLYTALRERSILVRHFSIPRIENYLRISIGTDEEMKALFAALKEILQ